MAKPDNSNDSANRRSWRQLAEYSQIGFVLPMAIVVGWLIGLALDQWLHTKWLYLVGVIMGSVAGFVELIRTMLQSDRRKDGDA